MYIFKKGPDVGPRWSVDVLWVGVSTIVCGESYQSSEVCAQSYPSEHQMKSFYLFVICLK